MPSKMLNIIDSSALAMYVIWFVDRYHSFSWVFLFSPLPDLSSVWTDVSISAARVSRICGFHLFFYWGTCDEVSQERSFEACDWWPTKEGFCRSVACLFFVRGRLFRDKILHIAVYLETLQAEYWLDPWWGIGGMLALFTQSKLTVRSLMFCLVQPVAAVPINYQRMFAFFSARKLRVRIACYQRIAHDCTSDDLRVRIDYNWESDSHA